MTGDWGGCGRFAVVGGAAAHLGPAARIEMAEGRGQNARHWIAKGLRLPSRVAHASPRRPWDDEATI
jgi:hypothetical protein